MSVKMRIQMPQPPGVKKRKIHILVGFEQLNWVARMGIFMHANVVSVFKTGRLLVFHNF